MPARALVPEHLFPTAHDDAWAAWNWLSSRVHKLGGDLRRVVVGEDASANLAMDVALLARDERGHRPVYQVLIHPIADTDLSTAFYGETLWARPIGMPAMRWRLRQLTVDGIPEHELRLQLVRCPDLAGIDPLRLEGEALAALHQAGIPVN
ncbi:MAG: alpha/beta hydrolase [Candidatus Devosia symbiotica]|nr:alpha/beta hydrolase [Candidatus Devosia symbiotica]